MTARMIAITTMIFMVSFPLSSDSIHFTNSNIHSSNNNYQVLYLRFIAAMCSSADLLLVSLTSEMRLAILFISASERVLPALMLLVSLPAFLMDVM